MACCWLGRGPWRGLWRDEPGPGDADGELPGLTDGDWMGGKKGKESSLSSRTLTTGKMVMPPPEMEKTWKMGQRG